MWKRVRNRDRCVTIFFCPQSVICMSFEVSQSCTTPFLLSAYERFDLFHLELESLTLFNPTRIARYVQQFLKKYAIRDPFVIYALEGPLLFETYVELPDRVPNRSDFNIRELKGLSWEYRYIYPTEHGQSVFYVAGIAPALIAQYQIFTVIAGLNVVAMIPASMALLHVYRYQHGTAFRRTQLAIDMLQHHNITDYFCTQDTFSRLVTVAQGVVIDRVRDIRPILVACGAFMSEGMADEEY